MSAVLTFILPLLKKAFAFIKQHPQAALTALCVLLAAFGWHEMRALAASEANAQRLTRNVEASQDTTRFLKTQTERLTMSVVSLDELGARYKASYDSLQKESGHTKATVTAGVVLVHPKDTIATQTATLPAASDSVRSAKLDTMGVHIHVAISPLRAMWDVQRDSTVLSILFLNQGGKNYVEAKSSDGAHLTSESPFVGPQTVVSSGWPKWFLPAGLVLGLLTGVLLAH